MAQHDYNLANQSGADFRADLNDALAAIVTVNSGATSPSTTFAHQLWVDTANSVLKIRNSANDAWITTGVSITADNTFDINGGTINGITSFSFSTGSTVTSILDEDDLSSDSATALATQQSIKAYVDSQVGSVDTLAEILLNGNTTGGTDIQFGDNDKAIFGTGLDLEIYHDGSDSYIQDTGTGDLRLKTNGTGVKIEDGAYTLAFFDAVNNNAKFYHNGNLKLETKGTGIDVTGNATFADNGKAIFGTGSDLQIFHDGSHSYISENGTGNLILKGGGQILLKSPADENMIVATGNGAVGLYYDNVAKLQTTSTGIDVTGEVQADTHFTSSDLVATLSTSGSGGAVYLRPNGQTQSSGQAVLDTSGNLDVTGTVTSDGVNSDGNVVIDGLLQFEDSGGSNRTVMEYDSNDDVLIKTGTSSGSRSIKFQTEASEVMRIDANANVGIGTSSPTAKLEISTTDGVESLRINSSDIQVTEGELIGEILFTSNDATLNADRKVLAGIKTFAAENFAGTNANEASLQFFTANSNDLRNSAAPSPRMTINEDGSVGVGLTSLTEKFEVNGSINTSNQSSSFNTGTYRTFMDMINSAKIARIGTLKGANTPTGSQGSIYFTVNGTTRSVLDQDGNLLIGKTAAGASTQGIQALASGNLGATSTNATTLVLNRKFSDGTIASFKKDNTTVGSIGANAGVMTLASPNGNKHYVANSALFPSADNILDLGTSSQGYKDLYLSGTGYFGTSVGIGTSSPAYNLSIEQDSPTLQLKTTNTTGTNIILFSDSSSNFVGNIKYNHTDNALSFSTTSTANERMRIDSSGNIGVGTTAPNNKLTVSGASDGINIVGTNSFVRWNSGNMMIRDEGSYAMGFHTYDGSTGQVERMRITSAGNIGIGTTTPNYELTVGGSDTINSIQLLSSTTGTGATNGLRFWNTGSSVAMWNYDNTPTLFGTNNTERARIDSSGHLLVGKTGASSGTQGQELRSNGYTVFTRSGGNPLELNRLTSDGAILNFSKDTSVVGTIGTESSNIVIDVPNTGNALIFEGSNGASTTRLAISNGSGFESFRPFNSASDDLFDLGSSTRRFKDIYATNGTIQTSDINEKQDIEDLSDAETRVAVAAKGLLKKYRWKSAVANKGDDARIHFGIMAQDLENAFANEGLDAGDYGMFISTTWTDEATGEEKTRLGVRYNELLAFIIAAI